MTAGQFAAQEDHFFSFQSAVCKYLELWKVLPCKSYSRSLQIFWGCASICRFCLRTSIVFWKVASGFWSRPWNVAVPRFLHTLVLVLALPGSRMVLMQLKGGSVTADLIGCSKWGKPCSTVTSVFITYELREKEMLLELRIFYCTQ